MKNYLLSLSKVGIITGLLAMDVAPALSSNTAPSHEGAADEVLFQEDFAGCTAALADSVKLRNTETWMLDPEMLGEEGWWGNHVYADEGAVALVEPGWGGLINTPCMNLYGRITVSFRYRVRPGNKVARNFYVNLLHGNPQVSDQVSTFEESAFKVIYMPDESEKGWQDFSITTNNPYAGDDAFVQINAQFSPLAGIEIDDLKITRNYDFVTIPTSPSVKEVADDSFTVAWKPGAENKSYLVNCIEQKIVSVDPCNYSENFGEGKLPETWGGEGCTIEAGKGFEGKDAIALSLNQTVYAPVNYSTVQNLKFSVKAEGLTDIYGMTVLQLLGLTETGEWEAPSEVMLLLVPAEGMVVDATEQAPKFLNKYIGFGFKLMNYLGEEAGKVYVSDVNWTTAGSQERVNLLERAKVSEPILTVDGITPESKYFVQVAGVNGERESSFTTLVEVKGVAAPKNVSATVKSKEDLVYTAEWDDVKNADAGYRIRNYMVSEAKATESGRTVILENFKTDLTELKYVKDRTLDDYTDMPGWTVENRTDQAGYAKVGGNQLGGDGRAVLVSPELCLNNNNGEFTVEFTLRGNGNVALDVIAGDETQTVNLPWLYDWETNQEVYGEKKCKLTFNSGDIATRIRFTSSNWHAFSLSNLSVNQDINKGEYIYSLNNIIDAIPGSTSADIDNKALGENIFACGVQSVMSNGDGTPYTSRVVMSPMVDFVSSSVGTMNITDITVGRTGRCIWISLPREAEITVYSTDGTLVCRILGHEGINVTETLPSGIYAVRCQDRSFKIIL